jgi:hypothetical protein
VTVEATGVPVEATGLLEAVNVLVGELRTLNLLIAAQVLHDPEASEEAGERVYMAIHGGQCTHRCAVDMIEDSPA